MSNSARQLNQFTFRQALDGLAEKKFTQAELVADLERAVKAQNQALNVFLSLAPNLSAESEAQAERPLRGLPLAVKDNISTRGLKTTAASTLLADFSPAFESTVTAKLKAAGATIQGKTNLDAWAHGSSTETSDYGRTLNPRNPAYLPGGSSGGSAAAVAANLALASLGTETGGSIRQPAAWCGLVGLKPSYGRCSRFGIVPMASSTDSPGLLTKTVEDAALLLGWMAGFDERDGTSLRTPSERWERQLGKPVAGLKVGWLYHDLEELNEVNEKIESVATQLRSLGIKVEPVPTGLDPRLAIAVYTLVQRAEVASNLARFDGLRYGRPRTTFGAEAKRRILLGTYALATRDRSEHNPYELAQEVRTLFIREFEQLFTQFDLVMSATSPSFAKKVGVSADSAMFGELEDMLLEPSCIAGLPGLSLPCYRDQETNLSLGLNLMAPAGREDLLFRVGEAYERNTPWNSWRNND